MVSNSKVVIFKNQIVNSVLIRMWISVPEDIIIMSFQQMQESKRDENITG